MSTQTTLTDQTWMLRCFDLARRGLGSVSPNPPVGAVLVHDDRILSEGFHAYFGGPHAEVQAIHNVPPADRHLIPFSTLYVSLEPCCLTGKTPPCTDLIMKEGIKNVRISTRDPNPLVAGKGIELLQAKGIEITEGILEEEGRKLIRMFSTHVLKRRPHIVLKWAQSKNGYTGIKGEQIWLSHPYSLVWSHKLRAETDAILIGARTVMTDNPSLTTREYPGRSPHRVIYDPNGKLTHDFRVFNHDGVQIYYFTSKLNSAITGDHIHQVLFMQDEDHVKKITETLHHQNIGSLLVEGGSYLHKLFTQPNLWDEAWVIRTQHPLDHGISAPNVKGRLMSKVESGTDTIIGIYNPLK